MNAPLISSTAPARPRAPFPVPESSIFGETLRNLTEEFAATAAELDASGEFPHANLSRLHDLGLSAFTVPTALGGSGATLAQAMKVISAVARGEPSTALILAMQYLQHFRLQQNPHWPEALRTKVARDAVENGALINTLRVEPELGTPARGGLPATVARRVPEGWLINGRKLYSTGIPGLTWLAVWARSDDHTPRVGTWLVRHDTPGIRIGKRWNQLGMRATNSHEVIFDNVLVPADHDVDAHPLIPTAPQLDPVDSLWMTALLSSIYDSVAHAARDWLVSWLLERKPSNLGAALATLPKFQQTIGTIDTLLLNNRVLLGAVAGGTVDATKAAQIKHLVTTNAIRAVELAVESIGNPALSRDNPLERHFRDVLCARIHTPQDDTILIGAGRAAFTAFSAPRQKQGRTVSSRSGL
nr:acyl-CoA dehydrogenase family protein [Paraburkholderia phytofirmans]